VSGLESMECMLLSDSPRIPNLSLTIYEKNFKIGGTWYENRYPSVACDVPADV
jgi:cation diffusion facilitator CzcD-associated flavoprotein CzcO